MVNFCLILSFAYCIFVKGLLLPNPSMPKLVFWQWINQSYNLGVNYSNRNASNELGLSQMIKAYLAAVGTSCGIAVGLSQAVRRGFILLFCSSFF